MSTLELGPVLRHVGDTTATVWVETSEACTVEVLGCVDAHLRGRGQHYALVDVTGSSPTRPTLRGPPRRRGGVAPRGHRDCRRATCAPAARRGPGACGSSSAPAATPRSTTPTSRRRWASTRSTPSPCASGRGRATDDPARVRPTRCCLLGDQVYADELTPQNRPPDRRPPRPRTRSGPATRSSDFDEYVGPLPRLLDRPARCGGCSPCVPTAMIFDDHDVRDDWNTSQVWRRRDGREAVVARADPRRRWRRTGSTSTWATSPAEELAADPRLPQDPRRPRATSGRCWSTSRTGPTPRSTSPRACASASAGTSATSRFVMIDSRNGRILDDGAHLMLGDREFGWIEEQMRRRRRRRPPRARHLAARGCCRTRSATCRASTRSRRTGPAGAAGSPRRSARAPTSSTGRRSAPRSTGSTRTDRDGVATGARTRPATVSVLSGDVHHSYAAEVRYPSPTRVAGLPAHLLAGAQRRPLVHGVRVRPGLVERPHVRAGPRRPGGRDR